MTVSIGYPDTRISGTALSYCIFTLQSFKSYSKIAFKVYHIEHLLFVLTTILFVKIATTWLTLNKT